MNSEELAANLFRATQTEAKIKRGNIKGQGKLVLHITRLGKRLETQLQVSEVQCLNNFLHQIQWAKRKQESKTAIRENGVSSG